MTEISLTIARSEPAGVGLGLHSPSLRALEQAGVLGEILKASRSHPEVVMERPTTERVASNPHVSVSAPHVPSFVTLSRVSLQEILARAVERCGVPVRFGTSVKAVEQDWRGARVMLTDGTSDRFDLVIAADGLHSAMRALTLPEAPRPTPCGQVIWRLAAHAPNGLDHYTIMVGESTRIGLVPLPGDGLYLWMLDNVSSCARPPEDQHASVSSNASRHASKPTVTFTAWPAAGRSCAARK